jgi:hypothetical protein
MSSSEELTFNLDPLEFEFPCPMCAFYNPITIGEARLGAPIICRGCKNTLTPNDTMGDLENVRRRMVDSVRELQETMERLGR